MQARIRIKKAIKKQNPRALSLLGFNYDLATSYFARRSPSKYRRREQSLRPCSRWERVGCCRFITRNSLYIESVSNVLHF